MNAIELTIEPSRIDIELVKQYIVVCSELPGGDPVNAVPGPADGNVAAFRVIKATPAGFAHASNLSLGDFGRVFGISLTAAAAGNELDVQTHGVVTNPLWTWSTGRVWLAVSGLMTQTVPTVGISQVVGVAVSATELSIAFERPIIL